MKNFLRFITIILMFLGIGVSTAGCAGVGGVVNAPFVTRAPLVEGAQDPASPVAAIGRAQSFAGMQAGEAMRCSRNDVEADYIMRQDQQVVEDVDLGIQQFGWNRNQRRVTTRTDSSITCVRNVDIGSTAPPRRRGQ